MKLFRLMGVVGAMLLAGGTDSAYHAAASGPPGGVQIPNSTPKVIAQGKARSLGAYNPAQTLRVAIALQPPNMAAEEQFLRAVQDRSSPLYHRFLTPDQWNAQFAPTAQSEQAVVDWARSQGLTVTQRYSNHLVVDVEAPVAALQTAFGVQINSYQVDGSSVFSNDRDPTVPASLSGIVHAVVGLNNVEVARPHSQPVKGGRLSMTDQPYVAGPAVAPGGDSHADGTKTTNQQPHFGTNGYIDPPLLWSSHGYDVQALYNLGHCCNPTNNPGSSPAQTSIAISTSGQFSLADINAFTAQYGLAYNLNWIFVDGTPPCCAGGDSFETTLDTEYSIAMSNSFGCYCTTAHVYVYEGANAHLSTFLDVDNKILSDGNARSFSTSWGATEDVTSGSTMNAFHAVFDAMVGQGWSLTAAAGDCGAYDDCNASSPRKVDYPASDPDMVAAGGTQISFYSNGSFASEVAWNGGGGGCSSYWSQPGYQSGISTGCGNRALPDVSLNASCGSGQAIYFNGGWGGVCGTSEVAPELAGLFAQFNSYLLSEGVICGGGGTGQCSPFGNPNWDVYREAVVTGGGRAPHYPFYDVTSGCNNGPASSGGYCAGTGYDMATGWGSFNALQLARAVNWEAVWDSHGPVITYSGPAVNHWYHTDQTIGWTLTDPLQSGDVVASGPAGFTQGWDGIPLDPFSHATPGSGDSFYAGAGNPNATTGQLQLSAAGQGCHTAHVMGWDNVGYNSGDQTYGPVCYDTVPPTTTALLNGSPPVSTTYTSPVSISLDATDTLSGVAGTFYWLDCTPPFCLARRYSGPFTVSANGTHTLKFWSTDVAGNIEPLKTVTFTVDVQVTIQAGAGWNMVGGSPLTLWSDSTVNWAFNPSTPAWYHPTGSEAAGTGAWEDIATAGPHAVSVQICSSAPTFSVVAFRWNLVGNPCSRAVSLPGTARAYWWNPTSHAYVPVSTIAAGGAAWVKPLTTSISLNPLTASLSAAARVAHAAGPSFRASLRDDLRTLPRPPFVRSVVRDAHVQNHAPRPDRIAKS